MTGIVCAIVGNFSTVTVAQVIRSKKSVIAVGNAQIDTAQSKFGGSSMLTDGTSDYLTIANASDLFFGTGDFTIEGWYRPTSRAQNFPVVFSNRNGFNTGGIVLHDRHNGASTVFTLWVYNANTGTPVITGTTAVSNGTWYHLAICRNGSNLRFFVNGTQEGGTYNIGTTNIDSGATAQDQYIGGSPETSAVSTNGHFDEWRISKTARYTANFTAPTAPFANDDNTVLLLHMDGTDATTFFEDDNGVRAPKGIVAYGNAQIDNAQSQFGGTSALFDGVDDRMFISNSVPINFGSGNLTIEMWYRSLGKAQNYPVLICNYPDYTPASNTWVLLDRHNDVNNTKFTFFVYNHNSFSTSLLASSTSVAINTWYHIAIVRNGNTWKMYINGTEESSATFSGSLDGTATPSLMIGRANTSGTEIYGNIDEVRLSNTARYTSNFTPSTTPFVNDTNTLLLLHMNGTDGSQVFLDDVGTGRAARGIQAIGNAQIDNAQSQFGGTSALFDGTGDYLIVPTDTDLQFTAAETWTIELWVRPSSVTRSRNILATYTLSSSFNGWGLRIEETSDAFGFWDGVAWRAFDSTIVANTWYHVAIVSTAGSVKMYQNGVQQTTTFTATSSINNTTTDVYIGSRTDGSFAFPGWIDEVRISNSARYAANFTPSTTPFVNDSNTLLLLHMDGTDGSTVFTDDNGKHPYTP